MALKMGIVGLPNVGKSTLFNAVTAAGAEAQNYAFCTIEPNVGIVNVPDPRLSLIGQRIKSDKTIPATVQLVDIAGLVAGASKGEGLGNKFLANIREVDAILHLVRCFEDADVVHVDGTIDPLRDIDTIETELMLSDLQVLERAADKIRKPADHDASLVPRLAAMDLFMTTLDDGRPLRGLDLSDEEAQAVVRDLGLITAKRVLYVANVDESDPQGRGEHVKCVAERAAGENSGMVVVCGKLEAELSELEDADRDEMLGEMGLGEPAFYALVRQAYQVLALQSYFTAGPKEIRAWTVPVGASAPEAAGIIHSDFERGFIRAEIYSVADLEKHTSEAAIRSAGKMRVEGRDYVIQDGDIVHFLFNV